MKVSGIQAFWMITIMDIGMTLLMTFTPGLQAAKQDAWVSLLVAGGIALLIAVITTKLVLLHPEQTFIQFSQTIMGKWLGKIVVVVYFVQWYTIIPIVLRQLTDLLQVLLLPKTPSIYIILVMVLIVIYVTYSGGIDGIGRVSEILGPLIFLMVLLVLISSVPNIQWKRLMPFYADSGMAAIVKGSLPSASYLGHAVEFFMISPFLFTPRKGSPYVIWAVAIASFFVLLSIIMVILTVGVNLSSKMWYPFFEMTKKISIFGFIENLDALAVVIWIASVFVKLSIYLFIASYGTAQFLQVQNWKNMIWFIAPVVTAFAFFPQNVSEATGNYLNNYWVPFVLPVNMIGLPLLLLIVGKIRQKNSGY
ncbi:endospore germination permease [Paenibacillus filicis]|uniref:Endospore germination permease n=1 Tax=Paenibacillus gyeongsangnamensis TaxID=3388067 RepID=A0ABT4Q7D8_9BACL|nr:endospore germination permease [Paenibacillus filicis]MCZ8512790.1 endospore germination permease [Paenibacillus filicis]